MLSKKDELLVLALKEFLGLHSKVWAELKIANLTTEQNDKDYFEFCEIVKKVHEEHGYNFYLKIDNAAPNNSWVPLFRKHVSIPSIEEMVNGMPQKGGMHH